MFTDTAKKVCTINTPFEKIQIKLSTNGILHSSGYILGANERSYGQFWVCQSYLDDFLIITSGSFEDHLAKFKEIIKQLQLAGLKCKIDKCKFAVPKVEYMGYIITQEGVKTDLKKIISVINIGRHKDRKQVRQFLGIVQ